MYNEEKLDEAIALLKEIDPSDEFDKATVDRYLGQMYAQKEQYKLAIKHVAAAVKPDVLNFADQSQGLKLLGDMYAGTEQYAKAKDAYYAWMDFTGEEDDKVYTRIAQANYELKQFNDVLPAANKAIKLAEEPSKASYQLKLAAYFELKQYKNMVEVAEEIVRVGLKTKSLQV